MFNYGIKHTIICLNCARATLQHFSVRSAAYVCIDTNAVASVMGAMEMENRPYGRLTLAQAHTSYTLYLFFFIRRHCTFALGRHTLLDLV